MELRYDAQVIQAYIVEIDPLIYFLACMGEMHTLTHVENLFRTVVFWDHPGVEKLMQSQEFPNAVDVLMALEDTMLRLYLLADESNAEFFDRLPPLKFNYATSLLAVAAL